MSKAIQIRDVPDEVHRTLRARAAGAGQSLSAYLLAELTRVAERPPSPTCWAGQAPATAARRRAAPQPSPLVRTGS